MTDGSTVMGVTTTASEFDPQSDAIWILSSTFIVFTMQSGKCYVIVKSHAGIPVFRYTVQEFARMQFQVRVSKAFVVDAQAPF